MGLINNAFYFSVGYYIGRNYSDAIQDFIEKNYDEETIHIILKKIFGSLDKEK